MIAGVLRLIIGLTPALARFGFVDGRRYIRFPDGSVHRAGERAYELRRNERKALKQDARKAEAKTKNKKAESDGAKKWEEQVRKVSRRDLS